MSTTNYALDESKAAYRRMAPADRELMRQFRQNAGWYRYWGSGLPSTRNRPLALRTSAAWRRKALQAAKGLIKRGHGPLVRAEWREMFKSELPD